MVLLGGYFLSKKIKNGIDKNPVCLTSRRVVYLILSSPQNIKELVTYSDFLNKRDINNKIEKKIDKLSHPFPFFL